MKQKNVLTIMLLSLFWVSCHIDEDPLMQPSVTLIEMEGEGGEAEVFITGEDWDIAGVLNSKGNVYISGDSYSSDGKLISENYTLTLEGLGRMEASWTDKGFTIIRNTPSALTIVLDENSSGEEFSFVVRLQSGEEQKEIIVTQRKSDGYLFDSIEYALKEGDGDSLYTRGVSGYRFDIQSPQEFSFSPFNGVDVNKQSYFESPEADAFAWLNDHSVEVPSGINESEVYHKGEKSLYTSVSKIGPHDFGEMMESVLVPTGKSEFLVEMEYRKRRVSYALVLTNVRTKKNKIIEGKWIEISPTGNYAVKWKDMTE